MVQQLPNGNLRLEFLTTIDEAAYVHNKPDSSEFLLKALSYTLEVFEALKKEHTLELEKNGQTDLTEKTKAYRATIDALLPPVEKGHAFIIDLRPDALNELKKVRMMSNSPNYQELIRRSLNLWRVTEMLYREGYTIRFVDSVNDQTLEIRKEDILPE